MYFHKISFQHFPLFQPLNFIKWTITFKVQIWIWWLIYIFLIIYLRVNREYFEVSFICNFFLLSSLGRLDIKHEKIHIVKDDDIILLLSRQKRDIGPWLFFYRCLPTFFLSLVVARSDLFWLPPRGASLIPRKNHYFPTFPKNLIFQKKNIFQIKSFCQKNM